MKFKGDVIITDPCYLMKKGADYDWEKCDYGDNMEALGFTKYLVRDTIYGDWSCTTYNQDTKDKIGSFCADAGLVGVFLLDEVLKYNPGFDYHTERLWTTTLIPDFEGEISIHVVTVKPDPSENIDDDSDDKEFDEEYEEVRVIGKGTTNFFTTQTGL